MSLFKVKSVVGIEMDAYEIRAAEVGGTSGKSSLLGLGRAYLPDRVVRDGKVVRPDMLKDVISGLWKDAKFKSPNVILGVSNQDVLLRFAMIPKAPQDKIDSLIRFQAQDFLPIAVSEVELDYIILDEINTQPSNMLKVLLVAGRRSMLNGFLHAVNDAGLKLMDIDVTILALARLLDKEMRNQTIAIINYTQEQMGLIIMHRGIPALARIVPAGQYNQSRENGFYPSDAENETAAVTDRQYMQNVSGILSDNIIGEIGSSISYFTSQNAGAVVEKCLFTSSGSTGRDTMNRLEERLGINVEILDPLKGLNSYHLTGNRTFGSASDFSAAISLALRGLEG